MPRKATLYTHDGKTMTVAEWADALGISQTGFCDRIKRKLPPEKVFASRHRQGRRKGVVPASQYRMLTHDGRTQACMQWAAELGISRSTLSRRLSRGWPPERVFLPGSQANAAWRTAPRTYEYAGRRLTAAEWARELGITEAAFRSRLRRHESPEFRFHVGCLPRPGPRPTAGILLTYNGKTQNMRTWAAELGLSPAVFSLRRSRGLTGDKLFAPKAARRRKEQG